MILGTHEYLEQIAHLESNVRGYVRSFPTVFETAAGSWLEDVEGNRYLDFFAGAGTLNYGHNNPLVKSAVLEYIARDGIQHALDMATRAKVEFLSKFNEVILNPRRMDYKVQFTGPTGTNSVEAAIKLARKQQQRSHIVAFTNAYHGHSLGSLALTGNSYYHEEFYGSRNNVSHLPFDGYLGATDTSEILAKMLDDPGSGLPQPAAVILETVQGEGGIRVASDQWLRNIEAICRRHDVLLIADEIQIGNGRSGHFFSFEASGIRPDLICISKSIGGGLPMSLLLIERSRDDWQPGQHTGTFRGNNIAFVAATALLEYWENDQLAQQVRHHGEIVASRLRDLAACNAALGFSVRGKGLMWGLDVRDGELADAISAEAFRRGLIIETAGPRGEVVKLLPPLTTTQADLQRGLNILEESLSVALSQRPAQRLPSETSLTEAPTLTCPMSLSPAIDFAVPAHG